MHTELPNEIALVQRALESDLSVSAVLEHLTVDNWWALASNHIDKLHSLQQTLLVEYERSARRMQRSGGLSRGVSMHSGGDFPMGPGRSPSGGRIGGGDRWGSGILDLGVFQSGHHNNSSNHRNSDGRSHSDGKMSPRAMSRVSSCSSLESEASGDPANNWAMMWGQINEGDEIGLPSGGGGGAAAAAAPSSSSAAAEKKAMNGHSSADAPASAAAAMASDAASNGASSNGDGGGGGGGSAPPQRNNSHKLPTPKASPKASPRIPRRERRPSLKSEPDDDLAQILAHGTTLNASQMPPERETLLRAAASLLVLGPASVSAGSMSNEAVREGLLTVSPSQLVEHLVALLDEQAQGPPPSGPPSPGPMDRSRHDKDNEGLPPWAGGRHSSTGNSGRASVEGVRKHRDDDTNGTHGDNGMDRSRHDKDSEPQQPLLQPSGASPRSSNATEASPEASPEAVSPLELSPKTSNEGPPRDGNQVATNYTESMRGNVLLPDTLAVPGSSPPRLSQQASSSSNNGKSTNRPSLSIAAGVSPRQSPRLTRGRGGVTSPGRSGNPGRTPSPPNSRGGGRGSGGPDAGAPESGDVMPRAPPLSPFPSTRREALRNSSLDRLSGSEWVIGLQEVTFQRKIGAGSAGTTYAAEWRGAQVAVKVAGYTGDSMEGWRAEVDALTKLRHPNIVQYLGCVISPPTYCLVLEFCDAGDLYRALRFPTPPGLTLRVARAVGAGMAYLHRRSIMHRDLKSSNVLLTTSGGVKLTDFGVAVQVAGTSPGREGGASSPMETSCDPLTTETGTYRWMAPEVTRHEGYTKSADVFSYGMLLFELIAHEVPFADRPPLQAAVAIGLQDLRPPLPEDTPVPIATLVRRCWNRRPGLRPKFDEVITTLQHAHAGLTPQETQWLDAPHGHPVYNNPLAGNETGGQDKPQPGGGINRAGQRATGGMSAIIEAHVPPPTEEKLTLGVSI